MISNPSVPRDQLSKMQDQLPEHWRPIMAAVRDGECGLLVVPQTDEAFEPPTDRTLIAVVGDDYDFSVGPDKFDRRSMKRLIRMCPAALVVSCEALVAPYAAAAAGALWMRQNTLIVETQPEHEMQWIALIKKLRPDVRLMIATVQEEAKQ